MSKFKNDIMSTGSITSIFKVFDMSKTFPQPTDNKLYEKLLKIMNADELARDILGFLLLERLHLNLKGYSLQPDSESEDE